MRIKNHSINSMILKRLVQKGNHYLLFAIIINLSLIVNSCDSKHKFTRDDLVGTWYVDKNEDREYSNNQLAHNLKEKYCSDEYSENYGCKIITLFSDGTFEQYLGGIKKGKWQIENEKDIVLYYQEGYRISAPHLFTLENFNINKRNAYKYGIIYVILNFGESPEYIPAYHGV